MFSGLFCSFGHSKFCFQEIKHFLQIGPKLHQNTQIHQWDIFKHFLYIYFEIFEILKIFDKKCMLFLKENLSKILEKIFL